MRKPCCCDKQDRNRGAWSKEEDQKLANYIQTHGEGSWKSVPQAAGLLRCGKSCRQRWNNYLRPNLKQGYFGEDEEDLIVKLHALLGNRWSLIAGRLPGRTDNEVKNYWNSHLRRKLMSMGIDPNNHQVRWKHHELGTRFPSNFGSMVVNANDKPRNHYNGRFSRDATSSLEDDASSLPDLNLDLSISVEPSSQMDGCMGIKDATPTTLSLFT